MSEDNKDKKNLYKQSLNLPNTTFPMEAKLVQNEPARLKKWQDMDLYQKVLERHANDPLWILHDGPPFANGDIHIGHLINKTLKDCVIRFRTMQGHQVPYVPGWDCHGLPIEHKIQQELGPKMREMGVVEVRKKCFDYAAKYATIQNEQFQRLGVLGDWAHPYWTMAPEFECSTLEVFAKFVENGLVYKKLKPVPWSITNQTALADAELEYKDIEDLSVYVEFPLVTRVAQKTSVSARDGLVDLQDRQVQQEAIEAVPAQIAVACRIIPLEFDKRTGQLTIAVADPEDTRAAHDLGSLMGYRVQSLAARPEQVDSLVRKYYGTATMVDGNSAARQLFGLDDKSNGEVVLLVWTTTPWTLPANLAVAVHPEVDYVAVTYRRDGVTKTGIIAAGLREKVLEGVDVLAVSKLIRGSDLVAANLTYRHPFLDRTGHILPALYVTTEDGTGLVHTAPGHGEDDYLTGLANGLQVYCPVLHNGTFDKTAPDWLQGLHVFKANAIIVERLKTDGLLLKEAKITHSYPHDWRSKTPIIFRATEQWFVGVDKAYKLASESSEPKSLRQRALDAVKGPVEFIPTWGQARINGMLESRPDWCISRQRAWGLPIPVFYNEQGEALLTPQTVLAVAKQFAKHGSEAWFKLTPAELLDGVDPGANFPKDKLRKETDIFDVWFESGSSWHDVLQKRPGHRFPCDLYLEGSDQHRGWFQLSLLPSLGFNGVPPYRQVLTHGFIVKPDGTKVSKSDKEYVKAVDEVNRHGADLLRLWCCSVDYQGDIPTSPKTIQEFGDKYRKIRNTLRYLLSNLYDFDPKRDAQVISPRSLDAWALDQVDTLIRDTVEAYDTYQTHRVFRLLHEFCSVQISSMYGNAMKDRLYCERSDSPLRRRCQMVMYKMVNVLTRLLAPMVVFTADEAWEHIQHKSADEENVASVHLASLPVLSGQQISDEVRTEWKLLFDLREKALLQLDALKKSTGMNKALDAEVVYEIADAGMLTRLQEYGVDLEDIVGCGCYSLIAGGATKVTAVDRREKYQACARSWKRRPDVGSIAQYPDLAARDAEAIKVK